MEPKTFKVGKLTIRFTAQDNATRREELGEEWEKIEFIPSNSDGSFANMLLGSFNPQERTSAFNAGIRFLMAPPKSRYIHLTNEFHPDRRAGHMGWIHFTQMSSTEPTTMIKLNGKQAIVQSPFTREPVSGLRTYGATSEWLRLVRVTEYTWKAMNDNTQLEATGVPSGSLLHGFISELSGGTTLIVYPVVTRSTKNGETYVFDNAQSKAKWLFATLSSIEADELTLETAARQYFTNALFFRISRQEMAKMDAQGEIDKAIQEDITRNAIAFKNGETVEPGREVMVDGNPVGLNVLASGQYMALVGTKEIMVETMSFTGRHRVAQLVAKHNGNLSLKTFVPEG
jgi:hypothetical protein